MPTHRDDYDLLRSYLLREETEEAADQLERRLLADAELFELAGAVEDDLLDACADGTLTPAEREVVLARLAGSPAGRERLALSRDLAVAARRDAAVLPYVRRPAARPVSAPPVPLPRRFSAWRWTAAAAALAVVVGGGFWGIHRGSVQATSTAQGNRPPATGASSAALPAQTFTLALMSLRGGEPETPPSLAVDRSRAQSLLVQLGEPDPSSLFRATVRNAAGVVWQRGELHSTDGGEILPLMLPAGLLAPGRYEMNVEYATEKGGPYADLGDREFDVVKKG